MKDPRTNDEIALKYLSISDSDLVNVLLKRNSFPPQFTHNSSVLTLLHLFSNNENAIRHILSQKLFDINAVDVMGLTALHHAVWRKNIPVIVLLLKNGANVNCTDGCGETPLFLAVRLRNSRIVKILLRNGAMKHVLNVQGNDVLDIVIEKGYSEMKDLLDKYNLRRLRKWKAMTNVIKIQVRESKDILKRGGELKKLKKNNEKKKKDVVELESQLISLRRKCVEITLTKKQLEKKLKRNMNELNLSKSRDSYSPLRKKANYSHAFLNEGRKVLHFFQKNKYLKSVVENFKKDLSKHNYKN